MWDMAQKSAPGCVFAWFGIFGAVRASGVMVCSLLGFKERPVLTRMAIGFCLGLLLGIPLVPLLAHSSLNLHPTPSNLLRLSPRQKAFGTCRPRIWSDPPTRWNARVMEWQTKWDLGFFCFGSICPKWPQGRDWGQAPKASYQQTVLAPPPPAPGHTLVLGFGFRV